MRRATRNNLILIAVVALLGVGVWWQVRHEVAQFEPPLSTVDPATLQTLDIRCTTCVTRSFVRVGGLWQMREPYSLVADAEKVNRLIAIAAAAVRSRRPASDFDLSRIGLDPPLIQLRLDGVQLDFGMTDALNGDRYVRQGEVIAMVPDRFSPYLLAAPESELDRHLLATGSSVRSIRLDGKDRPELITPWKAAQATAIQAHDAQAADAPLAQIELILANDASIRYALLRRGDQWLALRESPTLDYLLDAQTAARLLGNDKAQ